MIYEADGYQKFKLHGKKLYVAKVRGRLLGMRSEFGRYSKKRFKRAREALAYSTRWADRHNLEKAKSDALIEAELP